MLLSPPDRTLSQTNLKHKVCRKKTFKDRKLSQTNVKHKYLQIFFGWVGPDVVGFMTMQDSILAQYNGPGQLQIAISWKQKELVAKRQDFRCRFK